MILRRCVSKGSPEKQSRRMPVCVCVCVCVCACMCEHVGGGVVYEKETLRLACAVMGTDKSKF